MNLSGDGSVTLMSDGRFLCERCTGRAAGSARASEAARLECELV